MSFSIVDVRVKRSDVRVANLDSSAVTRVWRAVTAGVELGGDGREDGVDFDGESFKALISSPILLSSAWRDDSAVA